MADKLTAIRIKQGDGYGPQIPIKANAENIIYKKHYNIEEILGNVDTEKGDLQKQINDVNNTIVNTTQEWLDEHYISPTVSFEVYDPTKTYQQNDYVIYKENDNQNLYICISNTPQPAEDWDSTKWQLIDLTIQIPTAAEVPIDDTLSLSGQAADAKAAGDLIKINQAATDTTKLAFNTSSDLINIPTMDDIVRRPIENGQYNDGEQGQLLRSNGDGTTEWVDEGLPTDDQVQTVVDAWMDQHSGQYVVPDESLTYKKLVKGTLGFVTPEMFGAKGDGITDDTNAVQACLNNTDFLHSVLSKTYKITSPLSVPNYKIVDGGGKIYSSDTCFKLDKIAHITIRDLKLYPQKHALHITTDDGWSNYNIFEKLFCYGANTTNSKGIFLETTNHYLTEQSYIDCILWNFQYGIYALNDTEKEMSGHKFIRCSTETSTILGQYIKNGNNFIFDSCRHAESISNKWKTEGQCYNLLINNGIVMANTIANVDFSESTYGEINGGLRFSGIYNYTPCRDGLIIKGKIVPNINAINRSKVNIPAAGLTINYGNQLFLYFNFNQSSGDQTLILPSEQYGGKGLINEFYIRMAKTNGDAIIQIGNFSKTIVNDGTNIPIIYRIIYNPLTNSSNISWIFEKLT